MPESHHSGNPASSIHSRLRSSIQSSLLQGSREPGYIVEWRRTSRPNDVVLIHLCTVLWCFISYFYGFIVIQMRRMYHYFDRPRRPMNLSYNGICPQPVK
ncbi:hypothetical protein EX30DRAFT_340659 [Ascodesmis nigricans]|uniref:Uncharacterized protein n=1 Tax=Ascodesmis nigricans TaxID=341454 RepID=A0A4S2MXJ5_9PEZI|nr:hypothetical protein EX30DRAFT_340659 [Ascodesmis nigricans]